MNWILEKISHNKMITIGIVILLSTWWVYHLFDITELIHPTEFQKIIVLGASFVFFGYLMRDEDHDQKYNTTDIKH